MAEQLRGAPIILVPGFWLGAWAWDEVVEILRRDGHEVTALTLPGLESIDADRSVIGLEDHVKAISDAVSAADRPVVLVVHSAAGFSGYAASDRVTDRIAAMVYVDTAPGKGAPDPDFPDAERPMVWEEVEAEENLDGLSEEHKSRFRDRAVPEPGAIIRESLELTNDARRDIPSTFICTGFTAEQYRTYAREHPDWAFLAGIPELRNTTWIDLPTSHWPMWSRPADLARIIRDVAHARTAAAVAALLAEAEHAHGEYETRELNGVYDTDWAQWYAEYAIEQGIGRMLGSQPTAPELAAALANGFSAFEAQEPRPPEGWAAFVAARLAAGR